VNRGTEGFFDVKASPVYDRNGNIRSIIVTHEEVTERKKAEEALRESNEKYRNIFENVAVSIILIDANGQMLDINPYHITQIGRGQVTKENLIGQNLFTHPTIVSSGISKEIKTVLEGKSVDIKEHYYPITSGGKSAYFNTRAVPLFADGEVTGAVIMCEDVTEIKSSKDRIRDLSQQLIKSQEKERQRISQELHDQVAQDLSAVKISCEMLLKNESLSCEGRNNLSGISDKLNKTLKTVRNLSYDLKPPSLEKHGLIETINRYCKDFSGENNINVEFFSVGMDNLTLTFEAQINLYRMVQESLNNVRKHAHASHVSIKLISSFPNIILRIEDDGEGFDTETRLLAAYEEKRMGVRSMKERVRLLQGEMRIVSIPGKGTMVVFEIPYKDGNIRLSEKVVE
jgi:PAS domain S-box-containing protein